MLRKFIFYYCETRSTFEKVDKMLELKHFSVFDGKMAPNISHSTTFLKFFHN